MNVRAYHWSERDSLWRWKVHRGSLAGPVLRSGIAFTLDDAEDQAAAEADTRRIARRIARRPDVPVDNRNPEG